MSPARRRGLPPSNRACRRCGRRWRPAGTAWRCWWRPTGRPGCGPGPSRVSGTGQGSAVGGAGVAPATRPDVRAAERRLAATAARQGVAAAELFPRITVTGVLGLLAGREEACSPAETRWRGPSRRHSVGRRSSNLGSAQARLRGAEAGSASRWPPTSRRCCWRLRKPRTRCALSRAAATPGEAGGSGAGELARGQHRARQVSRGRGRLSGLAGRRTHRAAGREESVAQAEAGTFTAVVALYKALGGIPQ